MRIKLDDLGGKALDCAAALALGYTPLFFPGNVLRSGKAPLTMKLRTVESQLISDALHRSSLGIQRHHFLVLRQA